QQNEEVMPDVLPFPIGLRRFFGDPLLVGDLLDRFEHEVSAGFYHGIHNVLDRGEPQEIRRLRRRRRLGTTRRSSNEQTCDQNPIVDSHDFSSLSMFSPPGHRYTFAMVLHAMSSINPFV